MKRETFTYVCMWTLLISSLFTTVTKQCLSEACRPRHALFFWRGYSSVSVNLIPVTLARFVYDCIEPNWASGRASGFSPRAAVRRGQTRPSSGRVFPPSLSSFILTQVKFPFWRTEEKKRRKEEEMNKRLNLAWKTLAHCEPDSGGGKSATLWVKCLGGGFYAGQWRLGKCGGFICELPNMECLKKCVYIYFVNNTWHCEGGSS